MPFPKSRSRLASALKNVTGVPSDKDVSRLKSSLPKKKKKKVILSDSDVRRFKNTLPKRK